MRGDNAVRDRKILAQHASGAKKSSLAAKYGVSSELVRRIIRNHKRNEEAKAAGLLSGHMSVIAVNAIRRATGVHTPGIIDLRRFILARDDWRITLHHTLQCGARTVREIAEFVKQQGIIAPGAYDSLDKRSLRLRLDHWTFMALRKEMGTGNPTVLDLRNWLGTDWERRVRKIRGFGDVRVAGVRRMLKDEGLI